MEPVGDSIPFPAQPERAHDVRFCPYCGHMSFDISEIGEDRVYCDFCGVDVRVEDLVKQG